MRTSVVVLALFFALFLSCSSNPTPFASNSNQSQDSTATPTPTTYAVTPIPTPQTITIIIYDYAAGNIMISMDNGIPTNSYPVTFTTTIPGQHAFTTISPLGNVSFNGDIVGSSYTCVSSSLVAGFSYLIFLNCAPTCSQNIATGQHSFVTAYYCDWSCP